MSEWMPLDPQQHAGQGFVPLHTYEHAADQQLCPVLVRELPAMLAFYPLIFVPQPDTAAGSAPRYRLMAMMAFEPGSNLYLGAKKQWLAPYVPSYFRAYPFGLLQPPADSLTAEQLSPDRLRLAFDQRSALLRSLPDAKAQPFFAADGQWSAAMKPVARFLFERYQSARQTQALVDELARFNLIVSRNITWQEHSADGSTQPRVAAGCYAIDERALANLPANDYHRLGRIGALGMAFAQVFSMARVRDLQGRHIAARRQAVPAEQEDISSWLGDEDDSLKF